MVDYNPERNVFRLDCAEIRWVEFGAATGENVKSPLRPVVSGARDDFLELCDNSLWNREKLLAQGERIEVPATDEMIDFMSSSIKKWREGHSKTQLAALGGDESTPTAQLVAFEDELAQNTLADLERFRLEQFGQETFN